MRIRHSKTLALVTVGLMGQPLAGAPMPSVSDDPLVGALRQGGHVIVLRHASSPRETPTAETANPDNLRLERQLDEKGRAGAVAMGEAIRALRIPIGAVLSSPTYRALETVRLARLPQPEVHDELGDGGHSMQGVTEAQASWLRKRAADLRVGTNTIVVTHQPNIARAFPSVAGVSDGEALVFGADGTGAAVLVGRIKIEDWSRLRR